MAGIGFKFTPQIAQLALSRSVNWEHSFVVSGTNCYGGIQSPVCFLLRMAIFLINKRLVRSECYYFRVYNSLLSSEMQKYIQVQRTISQLKHVGISLKN